MKLKLLGALGALLSLACAASAQVTITPLPTPPSRSDPGNFSNRADAFLGALPLFGTQLNNAANAAVTAATTAVNAPGTQATSTTSLAIGTGSKSLTIQTGKSLMAGQFVQVAASSAVTNFMAGQIAAYDSGTGALTVSVGYVQGSGTYAAWNVSLAAAVDPSKFVQIGGGAGMLGNAVKLGWSGSRLKAAYDSTDLGNLVTDSQISDVWRTSSLTNLNQLTNGPGYITGINSSMINGALGYTPAPLNTTVSFGDTYVSRSANTGVLYLGSNASHYVYYDGTNYNMPGGQLLVSGQHVWHAGNFNPAAYAALSGATFTGQLAREGQFFLDFIGSDTRRPYINFDANTFMLYNRDAYQYGWFIAGGQKMTLDGSGNLYAASFQPTSDRRLKSSIRELNPHLMLAALRRIGGKSYVKGGHAELGVIAQDVRAVLPALVGKTPEGMLTVNYNGLTAPLITVVTDLADRIEALERRLSRRASAGTARRPHRPAGHRLMLPESARR